MPSFESGSGAEEEEEEDYFNDLEVDLGSELEENEEEYEALDITPQSGYDDAFNDLTNDTAFLNELVKTFKPSTMLSSVDMNMEPKKLSIVYRAIEKLKAMFHSQSTSFIEVLPHLNELSHQIRREIDILYQYSKNIYSTRFTELDTIAATPYQYAKVTSLIEGTSDDKAGQLPINIEIEAKLSKEQVLVLRMSMQTSFLKNKPLEKKVKHLLLEACSMIIQLTDLQNVILQYISSNVSDIAPNLCVLVGPEVASLLIAHTGGILQLAEIPSCNLASIGKNRHLSHELHTTLSGVRQEGYIYSSELVQNQPIQNHKQMLRMVCAKVALAARVDAGQRGAAKNDLLGQRWREELETKIQKVTESPNISNVKPLPIPEDKPKKKRAGRKFRKYKQQFQLSHLRQLQNRMEFGKQEQSTMDAFGEEIGMGMTSSSIQQSIGGIRASSQRVDNSAKITKVMKRRLKEADSQSKEFASSLNSREF
ncbi:hypothetical protein NCAS_0E01160 [Naumovozyma castellii]|uniref:Nop domain-containing protein n=1 Tax=Naumovozyma castellii TaxID=27288 RepID=G0VFC0_NAUCA|nr:hypothetical protein NCAS_0E01160 [Naumovozyma castellii CBS 4309]CCC70186.1 hypothetical protein NCAS_0E01160 [Naumovozyma castellii CBS 4309]